MLEQYADAIFEGIQRDDVFVLRITRILFATNVETRLKDDVSLRWKSGAPFSFVVVIFEMGGHRLTRNNARTSGDTFFVQGEPFLAH